MKICVFSDSHGNVRNMISVIEFEKPKACFFLGDGERDFDEIKEMYPALKCYAVKGNCDFMSLGKTRLICEIDGIRVYATHGHKDDVKWEDDYRTLEANARSAKADLALFGHTHIQYLSERGDLTLLNPGSIGYGSYISYGVIETNHGMFSADLKAL